LTIINQRNISYVTFADGIIFVRYLVRPWSCRCVLVFRPYHEDHNSNNYGTNVFWSIRNVCWM